MGTYILFPYDFKKAETWAVDWVALRLLGAKGLRLAILSLGSSQSTTAHELSAPVSVQCVARGHPDAAPVVHAS